MGSRGKQDESLNTTQDGILVVFPGKRPGHGLVQEKSGVGRAVCPHDRTPRTCLPGLPGWGAAEKEDHDLGLS